jgi:hypothetical protein
MNANIRFIEKYIEYLCAIAFLILCVINFPYYFSGKELGGWDTPGHFQLAKVYANGFREFRSLVWDEGWFSGFPAFYFYPPFFYFFVTILFISLPITFTTAFGLGIFCIIPLLAYSLYRFFKVYLGSQIPKFYRIALSYSAIFFYLAYAGDGLQGTSVIGMWEGTFISNLGHAFLILSLCDLESYRKSLKRIHLIKFVIISALLICTHFLSFFFWFLAVTLHVVFFFRFWRREIIHLLIAGLAIFLLSSPSWINYIKFGAYTSGVFYGYTYPPLLSILGKDVYDQALVAYGKGESFSINYISLLIVSGRIVSILAITGFLYEVRKNLKRNDGRAFIAIFSLGFLWLSLDNTIGYIFPGVRIHNYRAFDSFFIGFSILMTLGLYHFIIRFKNNINTRWFVVLLLIFTIRNFLYLNPPAKEGLASPYFNELLADSERENFAVIEDRLSKLAKGSLVFPEITRGRSWFSSPHFWSNFLRKHKLRNALGLTVESSLYPTLLFNWEQAGLQHTFRWGTEIDWSNLFFDGIDNSNFETQLPSFFQRSGIEFVIGHTNEFKSFIHSRKNSFQIIEDVGPFLLAKVIYKVQDRKLPAGFVSDGWLHERKPISPNRFLRESNAILANLHAHNITTRIINMDTDSVKIDESIQKKFSMIFLHVNPDYIEESQALAKSFTIYGIPVVLLNAPASNDQPLVWDWSPRIYDQMTQRMSNLRSDTDSNWIFTTISYFPDLEESSGKILYHSDSNQIAVFDPDPSVRVDLPKLKSQILTLLLFLLPIAYLVFSLTRKMR